MDGRVLYTKKEHMRKEVKEKHGLPLHEVYILAFDTFNGNGRKRFMYFLTHEQRHGFILRNCYSNVHAYEVIPELNVGHKVYIVWDIDRKLCMMDDMEQWIIKNLAEAKARIIDCVLCHFANFARDHIGIEFNPLIGTNVQVSQAEVIETKPVEKLSLHVRLNLVCNCWGDVKTITESFIQYLLKTCTQEERQLLFTFRQNKNDKYPKEECIIDTSIYSNFRSMRKLYQSKGTSDALKLRPYGASSTLPEDHDVIYIDLTKPDVFMDISKSFSASDLFNEQDAKDTANMIKMPQNTLIRLSSTQEKPKCLVKQRTIDYIKGVITNSPLMHILLHHTSPCMTEIEQSNKCGHTIHFAFSNNSGCSCPAKGAQHSKNRFYLAYNDLHKTLTVRCYNPKCKAVLKQNPVRYRIHDCTWYVENQAAMHAKNSMACMLKAVKWDKQYASMKVDQDYPIPTRRIVTQTEPTMDTSNDIKEYTEYTLDQGQFSIEEAISGVAPKELIMKKTRTRVKKKQVQDIQPTIQEALSLAHVKSSAETQYLEVSGRAIIAIKAQMGLGKTEKLVEQLAQLERNTSVLVVTHSRVFSNKMKAELNSMGFKCYMDEPSGDINERRVVCCLDSCPRLTLPSPEGYDIVIIDELLSVLGRASSGFMRHDEVYTCLEHILEVSKVNLYMDAYVDHMFCYLFTKHIEQIREESCTWIHNTYVAKMDRKCMVIVNKNAENAQDLKNAAIYEVKSLLDAGKKVVVSSSSRTFVNALIASIQDIDKYKVATYTRDTDRKALADAINDPHEAWKDLDLLAYSPCITSGISFKLPHYDGLVAYMENSSRTPMVDACLQQIFRVRQLSSPVEGGRNMKIFINDTRKANILSHPLDLGRLERDQDNKLKRKMGSFEDGEWELPEYLCDMDESSLPYVPKSRKAMDQFPTYDKDRLSWTMLIGIIYLRNKSACFFTDIVVNTLQNDYGIETDVVVFDADAMACPQASKLVPDASLDIVVPYCEEIHIDDETFKQLHGAPANEKHSSSETVIVHPIGEDGSKEPYSVPLHALTRAQAFAYDLAYKKYKIDRPFNKAFFDEYIKDANSNEGRKRALELFFTWCRLCDLSRTKQDNQERYAKIIMDRRHALDRNFTLHYDTQQDEYHNKLITGQEMIEALIGSSTTLTEIDQQIIISHETFHGHARKYVEGLSSNSFRAIRDAFGFRSDRYNDTKNVATSTRILGEFVKKIAWDAFAIEIVYTRSERSISTMTWHTMRSHKTSLCKEHVHDPLSLCDELVIEM